MDKPKRIRYKTKKNVVPIDTFNIVGIDPGYSGAITVFNVQSGKVIAANIVDMPASKATKQINTEDLALWICDNTFINFRHPTFILIEQVHAFPKQGVTGVFSFGRSFGNVEGMANTMKLIAKGNDIPLEVFFVTPKAWQKNLIENHTWLNDYAANKKRNHSCAIKLYPSLSSKFVGPKGGLKDGRVDATLIAEFGRRALTHEIDFFLTTKATRKTKLISQDQRTISAVEAVTNIAKVCIEGKKWINKQRPSSKKGRIKANQRLHMLTKKLATINRLRKDLPGLDKRLKEEGI